MNKKISADKEKFTISCYGVELPFEWYCILVNDVTPTF